MKSNTNIGRQRYSLLFCSACNTSHHLNVDLKDTSLQNEVFSVDKHLFLSR